MIRPTGLGEYTDEELIAELVCRHMHHPVLVSKKANEILEEE